MASIPLPDDLLNKVVYDAMLDNVDQANLQRTDKRLHELVKFEIVNFSRIGPELTEYRIQSALAGGHCRTLDVRECCMYVKMADVLRRLPARLKANIELLRVDHESDAPADLFARFPSLKRIEVKLNNEPTGAAIRRPHRV